MKILLKEARIYDTQSDHHLETMDILVEDGKIKSIAKNIECDVDQTITSDNLCVSPGWVDVGAFNGEPGYEQRESLQSLKESAAKGGYTYIAPLPNTKPVADTKASIQYLRSKNNEHATKVIPLASATAGAQGVDMSEIIDLIEAGAVACTDGGQSIIDSNALMRILQYAKGADAHYIHYLPHNRLISEGQIHEGEMSVQLGMVGIPSIEESMQLQQAITVADYLNVDLYVQHISTQESLALIEEATGHTIASVSYLNLLKDHCELSDFDVNLKVLPPLRTAEDVTALKKAVEEGVITAITSNHVPQLTENKDKEFGLSEFGAIGLSTCFSALMTHASDIPLEHLVNCLSHGGYEMLRLPSPTIDEGSNCVITIFDPTQSVTIDNNHIESKCSNNPYLGETLKGKVLGIINVDQHRFFV